MQNRLKHFRAGLVLVLSSALSLWVISYWLPLNEYLSAIADPKYKDYLLTIRAFVASYLIFFLMTLVTAGLAFTKISKTIKFYLALVPGALILLLPFLLAIPIAIKYPERNYFEVFQAMYRLFRFTKVDIFITALVITLLCFGLNLLAALIFRRTGEVDKVNKKFQTRYIIYAGVSVLVLVASGGINYYNSYIRNIDRASCHDYLALPLPELDEDVATFLNNIQVYGEQAGSAKLKSALITFAMTSRQYYAVINSEADDSTLSQFEVAVATAKQNVVDLCSEFGTD